MKLTPIIGLEIHVQLKTKSKMFCSCDNAGENQPPNTTVCPVCMGHPGTLPVANREAIAWAAKTALALNCQVPETTKFDRKNYFYPDLPKGYQISQFDQPIGPNGSLTVQTADGSKTIRITRLHLEEDAAKNFHSSDGQHTLVDYNRAGTPLMEIVTEPDLRNAQDAKLLLQELRLITRYLGVSDADMEKGHLRCDANVSLTDQAADSIRNEKLSPKTEIKNLNSFKSVERAIEYEIMRQAKLWEAGTPPADSSTRGWNEDTGTTEQQRHKEGSHDYRYFPEPDLPPIHFDSDDPSLRLDVLRRAIGELPAARRSRFVEEFGLTAEDAKLIVEDRKLADFYEQVISELRAWLTSLDGQEGTAEEIWDRERAKLSKLTANWLLNKLLGITHKSNQAVYACKEITPENFAEFVTLLHARKMNSTIGLQVLEQMCARGSDPSVILDELSGAGFDENEIDGLISKILTDNPKEVTDYRSGKQALLQFFIGQLMKATKGQVDPVTASERLKKALT